MNKVKDNAAVPDHEKEEKEIRMEKVRQEKSTSIFFLNKIPLFLYYYLETQTHPSIIWQ